MAGTIAPTESNTLSSIISLTSKAAPILATVLGSPMAGIGVSLLTKAFNLDTPDSAKLLEVMRNDPGTLVKLRTIESTHQTALLKIASDNYRIEVDDRKSAREREIAIRGYIPSVLAVGFLINYAAIQFYCVTHPSSAIDIISARFQDVMIMIISYFFGSSHAGSNSRST